MGNILNTSNSDQALSVVITGGTRGIGFALAEAFLKLGWSVMISARNVAQLN
ncbi:MAG: SDR family NAD(P)-dependent oxidoreductase, partial [Pseudomonadota bacterium]